MLVYLGYISHSRRFVVACSLMISNCMKVGVRLSSLGKITRTERGETAFGRGSETLCTTQRYIPQPCNVYTKNIDFCVVLKQPRGKTVLLNLKDI